MFIHHLYYIFCLRLAQDKDQRSMDMDTAKAMLALLLGKNWPLFSSFHQFLEVGTLQLFFFPFYFPEDMSGNYVMGCVSLVSSKLLH